ncbi:MAG: hypothetical protein ABRQ38_27595 [Candidatus Eremiobacterota bacterium]
MNFFLKISGLIILLAFMSFNIAMADTEDNLRSGTVTLQIWKAYRFPDEALLESDDHTADISFLENPDIKKVPMLEAKRIKAFGKTKPDITEITASDIDLWDTYVNAPITGYYYMLQGKEKGKYYILFLKEFLNKKESLHYWKITFQWEEVIIK